VKFAGVDARATAEDLRGALYVPADEARALDEDEFWEHDLVGAEVEGEDGGSLGRITGVEAGPGQDRLIVETPAGERMIPVVKEIVKEVDVERGRIVIDPPEGLLG
jgi:16S rRNA processing protein RimM